MKTPLSWLRDFIDLDLIVPELAHRLTLAGLEVEEIRFVGLQLPENKIEGHSATRRRLDTLVSGFAWDRENIVLTGAPNLFPYKGQGTLARPIKVAYAREGARIYDGHKTGWEQMTLKRAKIRGVESYSMACSEKELGISEDHEGIILLDDDAPVGTPLADYMGDAVLDIAITPNIARNANILGVAREISALTGLPLRPPSFEVAWSGPPMEGRVSLEIRHPELNPRFVLGLIEGVTIHPSPYWMQRRLRLAGMRPINNIVDATNHAMLEIGEPLHAFDYDILVARAEGKAPKVITRLPQPGEKLVTLDGVERSLDDFTVLVADEAGALSIAGVMGGAQSEVSEGTTRVLLEGAAWNPINIRRTVASQRLSSEAAYRFARGVHPAMAERGVRRCLTLMQQVAGGAIAKGLVDAYPLPVQPATLEISTEDAARWLGVDLAAVEMADLLRRLEFRVEVQGESVLAITPDHRLDIGEGVVGTADLMEEIARIYGYDRIQETLIADELPPQYGNLALEREEAARDLLAGLGLQEVVSYRLTSPERESRLGQAHAPSAELPYVRVTNPISSERSVMRRSLLASLLEAMERNARQRERIALFEIGPVFLPLEGESLPQEPLRLAIALAGRRAPSGWLSGDQSAVEFYGLKGILEALMAGLHLGELRCVPCKERIFHPGKCSRLSLDGRDVGVMGELHPHIRAQYDLPDTAIVASELDLEAMLALTPKQFAISPIPPFPPVLEDLALVLDEEVPAERVEGVLREAGAGLLADVRVFDVYRGEQIGQGKKSLAYSLVYQASDRTLTDEEVAAVRAKLVKRLVQELRAKLRE